MTEFETSHEFPDTPVRVLLEAFASADHQAMQDRGAKVARRETIERRNDAAMYRCVSRVFPERQLPAFVRPFVRGGLEYHEVVTWDKSTDVLTIDVQPAVLNGRSRIEASARVIAKGTTAVRLYSSKVTVDVALVGRRMEKTIIDDLEKTMAAAAERTRAWLVASSRSPA